MISPISLLAIGLKRVVKMGWTRPCDVGQN